MKRRHLLATGPALIGAWLGATVRDSVAQASVVKFGQSASLSGGQAAYGAAVRDGVMAAFEAANRASKGSGPRFELVGMDDGGDREKCKSNVKALIETGVVGLVGLTSGAAAEACLPLVEESQVSLIGTASGNMGLRSPGVQHAFHVRAGYDEEYRRLLQYIKSYGLKRVGYVYLKDTSPANREAMTVALKSEALELAASVGIDRNAKSFDDVAHSLLAAKVDALLFTTNAAPIAPLVDRLAGEKFNGMVFSSSFAGQGLIDATKGSSRFLIMAQVVPRPNAEALPLIKAYRKDLSQLSGNPAPGFTSLEGYIAGRVAVDAVRQAAAGGAVSRQRLLESLRRARVDLGGYVVAYDNGDRSGSRFVDVVAFGKEGRIIG